MQSDAKARCGLRPCQKDGTCRSTRMQPTGVPPQEALLRGPRLHGQSTASRTAADYTSLALEVSLGAATITSWSLTMSHMVPRPFTQAFCTFRNTVQDLRKLARNVELLLLPGTARTDFCSVEGRVFTMYPGSRRNLPRLNPVQDQDSIQTIPPAPPLPRSGHAMVLWAPRWVWQVAQAARLVTPQPAGFHRLCCWSTLIRPRSITERIQTPRPTPRFHHRLKAYHTLRATACPRRSAHICVTVVLRSPRSSRPKMN